MINKMHLRPASRCNVYAITYAVPIRYSSQDIRVLKEPKIENLRRGTGGRSSFCGVVATVFGASGFIGRHVCNELGRRGAQLIIPHRSDPDDYRVKKLKLVGDLGQVLFQPFNGKDQLSIRKAVKYSNVVINLIGSDFETKNYSFKDVHVTLAKDIAAACSEYNVERLIHFSSLNVTENPEKYYLKKLKFLPTKLEGEKAVLEEYPTATIFRPSVVFGPNDRFLCALFARQRATSLSVPLYAAGKKTIRQPVFANDVGKGVWNAITDYDTRGKIYQIVGPDRFYLRDIVDYGAQILQRQMVARTFAHDILYDPLFLMKVLFTRYISGVLWHYPRFNLCFEQIERESVTDVVDKKLPTLQDLGVALTNMEDLIPYLIMKKFLAQPDRERALEDYYPAETLASKAIKEFS